MAAREVSAPFERSRKAKYRRTLRGHGKTIGGFTLLLLLMILATEYGLWHSPWPAAIGTGLLAFAVINAAGAFTVAGRAYVALVVEGPPEGLPPVGEKFGRALFRFSGRLDDWAREAGLRPLADFESPDVMTGERGPKGEWPQPQWHDSAALLATVEHLLTRVRPDVPLHEELMELAARLRVAAARGSRCYLFIETLANGTNAQVDAIRRGEAA
jgi:hypothetical protein